MKFSRRNFIKTTGAGVIAAGIPGYAAALPGVSAPAKTDSFKLAIAGYSFARLKLDDSLAIMKKVGVNLLGVKDFHLPLNSTREVIDQTLAKMKSFDVEPYGVIRRSPMQSLWASIW